MRAARSVKIALGSVVGLLVLSTAVIGFAHTKPGRPLLTWLGMNRYARKLGGSCPLGYDVAATPAQKEAGRRAFASTHAGVEKALSRPALGFVLDETTRDDVKRWAHDHGVTCVTPKSGHDLDCHDVRAEVLPARVGDVPVQSLWLDFGGEGRLISVIAVRKDPSVEKVASEFTSLTQELAHDSGPATKMEGDPSATHLASGGLQQASAEYRFRDYYALTRETNMGNGFLLTEEYRSLPE